MLIIDLTDSMTYSLEFAEPLHSLFYDYACDLNIECEPSVGGEMFGTQMNILLPRIEIWAMEKYKMKIKFIPKSSNKKAIGMIFIGWDGLNKDECKNVLLNMYPKTVAKIQQQNN